MAIDVQSEPAVVMFTKKAPKRIDGHSPRPPISIAAIARPVGGQTGDALGCRKASDRLNFPTTTYRAVTPRTAGHVGRLSGRTSDAMVEKYTALQGRFQKSVPYLRVSGPDGHREGDGYTWSMLSAWLFHKHLEEDEHLVRAVHKHWFLGLKSLFWPTLFFVASWTLLAQVPTRAIFLFTSLVSVIVAVWWLRNFFDYYLDAWIITDHGIIDVAWHGWFHRESSRVLYSDIQGVSYEVKGIIGTLFYVGSVSVEKISTGSEVSLEFVKNPRSVETTILKCMESYLQSKNLKDGKQVQELLAQLLSQQVQLQELQGVGSDDDE